MTRGLFDNLETEKALADLAICRGATVAVDLLRTAGGRAANDRRRGPRPDKLRDGARGCIGLTGLNANGL
jgi:hypothetical protein